MALIVVMEQYVEHYISLKKKKKKKKKKNTRT